MVTRAVGARSGLGDEMEEVTAAQKRLLQFMCSNGFTRSLHGPEWATMDRLIAAGLAEKLNDGRDYWVATAAGREAVS